MNQELKEKLALLETLSKIYMNSNFPIETLDKNDFMFNLAYMVKSFSLSNLPETLKLLHLLFNHQDSNMKLDCKSLHCIECYAYFMDAYFFTETNRICSCTCGKLISPLARRKILDNYDRIMGLRRFCQVCSTMKDLMEFCVINTHSCLVCTSCIVSQFKFTDPESPCLACGQSYDSESLFSIRTIMAESQPRDLVVQVFGKTCKNCDQDKDLRVFLKICEKGHECCKECGIEMINKQVKRCFECQSELSIILDSIQSTRINN